MKNQNNKKMMLTNKKLLPNLIRDKFGIHAYGTTLDFERVQFNIGYCDCTFAARGVYYAPFVFKYTPFEYSFASYTYNVVIKKQL